MKKGGLRSSKRELSQIDLENFRKRSTCWRQTARTYCLNMANSKKEFSDVTTNCRFILFYKKAFVPVARPFSFFFFKILLPGCQIFYLTKEIIIFYIDC